MIEKRYFKNLNDLIKKVIKETGQTQTSVAEKMGVSFQGLWEWCNGNHNIPATRCHEFTLALHSIIPVLVLRPDVYLDDTRHVDFECNKTFVLNRLEEWKYEQSKNNHTNV